MPSKAAWDRPGQTWTWKQRQFYSGQLRRPLAVLVTGYLEDLGASAKVGRASPHHAKSSGPRVTRAGVQFIRPDKRDAAHSSVPIAESDS